MTLMNYKLSYSSNYLPIKKPKSVNNLLVIYVPGTKIGAEDVKQGEMVNAFSE
jgi:hypothetical protein